MIDPNDGVRNLLLYPLAEKSGTNDTLVKLPDVCVQCVDDTRPKHPYARFASSPRVLRPTLVVLGLHRKPNPAGWLVNGHQHQIRWLSLCVPTEANSTSSNRTSERWCRCSRCCAGENESFADRGRPPSGMVNGAVSYSTTPAAAAVYHFLSQFLLLSSPFGMLICTHNTIYSL